MASNTAYRLRLSKLGHLLTPRSLHRNVRSFSAVSFRFNSPAASPHDPSTTTASQTTTTTQITTKAQPHTIGQRWLTLIKRRIGKCLMFGLKPAQVDEAGRILQRLAKDWRDLIAGSEGFLTTPTRRSLFRRDVVWGEMDSMGHVNNVAYARYAETARVNLMQNYALHIDPAHQIEWLNTVKNKGIGLILQSLNIHYKFPMTWPDKITVYHRLILDPSDTLPKSYFQQEALILSESKQRPAARVSEQNFLYDYTLLRKTDTPPEFILRQFQKTWAMQEESKREWQQQVADIENEVRKLELESWDNPNAVEDMGSSGR